MWHHELLVAVPFKIGFACFCANYLKQQLFLYIFGNFLNIFGHFSLNSLGSFYFQRIPLELFLQISVGISLRIYLTFYFLTTLFYQFLWKSLALATIFWEGSEIPTGFSSVIFFGDFFPMFLLEYSRPLFFWENLWYLW